jgi:perosamine synthetase
VRLPVLVADEESRQALLCALDAAGIGATGSYPAAIVDIPELRGRLDPRDLDCPSARAVAARIVTLPTHPYLRQSDIESIAAAFRAADPGDSLGGIKEHRPHPNPCLPHKTENLP